VKGLQVAYIPQIGSVQVDPEVAIAVRGAAKVFEDLGAHVEELDAPFDDSIDLFTVIWNARAAQVVSSYGPEARARMDSGLLEIAAEGSSYSLMSYLEATMQRANLGVKLSQFHERFDLLLTPTLPLPAFEAGHEVPQGWPGRRWQTWTPFTYPFNLTQQPAISVPCGMTTSGLPIGLQLVGAKYRDALVLRAAYAYESSSPMAWRCNPDEKDRISGQRVTLRHVSNGSSPNHACTISMHVALQRSTSFQRNSGTGPLAHPSQPALLSLVSCGASPRGWFSQPQTTPATP